MIRSKERLAVIRIYENTIVVETIHFPDEVRQVRDVPNVPEEVETGRKELDTTKLLIDQLTTTFDPKKYEDEYRTELIKLIEEKKGNAEVVTGKEKAKKPDNVTDLMEVLQASLEKAKKDKPKPRQPKRRTTKKKAK